MANPLARAIMGNNLSNKKESVNKISLHKRTHKHERKNDVDTDLTQLINNLVQGESSQVKVRNERRPITSSKKITLEEAADRVRNGL